MNNLKKLTWENHKNAERTSFMRKLMNRNITPYQYYTYLKNQYIAYRVLEYYSSVLNMFCFENEELYPILRCAKMIEDIEEMERKYNFKDVKILPSTLEYEKYIKTIKNDRKKLLAHIYVRHMGDLSGGQIIKKYIPGPTRVYEFEENTEVLKNALRKRLHDGLADEANKCFIMVQKFLQELDQDFDRDVG